jgi:riboflavin synthase
MFTGLIEAVGTVASLTRGGTGGRLRIAVQWPDDDAPARGDSIAVDGACLTAVDPTDDGFAADLSLETLDRTLLGSLASGDRVNLERALRLGDRLGGHIVQGHVDTVAKVLAISPQGSFQRWRFELPSGLRDEVAPKGSIAVHGVSLTVAALGAGWFEVALIPATIEATTLGSLRPGSPVHLETDVLAKYVARRIEGAGPSALEEIFGSGGGGA